MNPKYDHTKVESRIYQMWEDGNYFTPKIPARNASHSDAGGDKNKKPFSIILPLPNANDPMHMGHTLFTVEDILIRYHRMKGDPTLWLPGGDHAGIETQYVFEKQLAKEGKSRFDFDRDTLYRMIAEFVNANKDLNKSQMKRLGFSLDWTRYHYSLEPEVVIKVLKTFKKMYADRLIYRAERLVNYCTRCGTAFSDLEINHVERQDALYYLKYGPFILATTRPETKFGDTAVAFHPGDKRYEKYLGQELEIPGVNGPFKVKVVADEAIDPKFGTGIEKVTPAHDFLDYEIAQRHNLPAKKVIDLNGRLTELAGRFATLKVKPAREAVVAEMEKMSLIDHIDQQYSHSIAVCYRCGTTIEPMLMPQWYVKTKPLAKPAIEAVKKGRTKIVPKKRFEKMYFDWMNNIYDWNISRQIVWGPRIPAWYRVDGNEQRISVIFIDKTGTRKEGSISELYQQGNTFEEITVAIQKVTVPLETNQKNNPEIFVGDTPPPHGHWIQETDTFDTWFLSGQWPLTTLGFNIDDPKNSSEDFKYFYPTSVLDTMWDILFFWVGRMMMFGLYLTKDVPFKVVHLHARVVDKEGKKMSKSRGNVLNPIPIVDKYGADALRMALVAGVAPGSDIALSEEKIIGYRNFSNKLWNIGRFILLSSGDKDIPWYQDKLPGLTKEDQQIIKSLNLLIPQVTKDLDNFRLGRAAENIYQFIWHEFADKYVESSKDRIKSGNATVLSVLRHVFLNCLKLLHPFMPFVTEEIWQLFAPYRQKKTSLIISQWPLSSPAAKRGAQGS